MNHDQTKPAAPSSATADQSSHLPAPRVAPPAAKTWGHRVLCDASTALRFFSILPLPQLPWERQTAELAILSLKPSAVAIAGALIGAIGAIVLMMAAALGLPPLLTASLAIAALVLATGAMHEDGLADSADGLGGGRTQERRLEIMRDSRSGAFGVVAIGLSLLIRVAALATLVEALAPAGAALVLIVVAVASRVASLMPMWLLSPARRDGLGTAASPPSTREMTIGALVTLVLGFAVLWPTQLPAIAVPAALISGLVAAWIMSRIAQRRIGGHTGDIAGAAQQLAEMATMIALVAAAVPSPV